MYEFLKSLIPNRFLQRNKKSLRKLTAVMYRGSIYQCTICDIKLRKFVKLKNDNLLCPNCGSLARTRRLWQVIEHELPNKTILHFSPSKTFKEKLEKLCGSNYSSSDFVGEFDATKNLDITATGEPDNFYDIIICYHVLEHIPNDQKAMQELFRIVKPGGQCVIQTPFKEGDIYENDAITSAQGRLEHFGQEDHCRIYSVTGLADRLKSVGFDATIIHYEEASKNRNGFSLSEYIIFAEKSNIL